MFELMSWLVAIPMVVLAAQWWLRALRFLIRNKRSLGQRIERMKSAFADGDQA